MLRTLLALLSLLVPLSAATLTWDPNAETDVASYTIYISGVTNGVDTVPASATPNWPIPATLVPAGYTATFFVTAVGATGLESDPSASVTYVSPANVTVPNVTTNSWKRKSGQGMTFSFAWSANPPEQNVTFYRVVIERIDVLPSTFTTDVIAAPSVVLTGTLPVGSYRWTVQAINANGPSAPSTYAYSGVVPKNPKNLTIAP